MKIDKAAIGIEVSWSFGDGDAEAVTLPRAGVRAAILRNGFDPELIPDLSPNKALRRAEGLVKGRSKTLVIQELRRPNKDTPMSVGIYQVQPCEGEGGDDVVCGARTRVQPDGTIEALAPEGQDTPISACFVIAADLARIANELLTSVVNRDISDAIASIGWAHGWITRRRNSGGVYFFPAGPTAERFVSLLHDLQAMTAHAKREFQFIPQLMECYPKPLTMAMWSDSARDQYDAQVADLVAQLKKVQTEDTMRESTLEKRAEECDRLIAQAESHRIFLQGHVEIVATELRRVQEGFRLKLEQNRASANEAFDALEKAPVSPVKAPEPVHVASSPAKPRRMKKSPMKPLHEMSDHELFEE